MWLYALFLLFSIRCRVHDICLTRFNPLMFGHPQKEGSVNFSGSIAKYVAMTAKFVPKFTFLGDMFPVSPQTGAKSNI